MAEALFTRTESGALLPSALTRGPWTPDSQHGGPPAALLARADVVAGHVILFTDGAGLGPATLQAAATLAGQGARLSLVSLGDPSPDFAAHADVGGGAVFTPDQTEALADWLGASARTRLERQDYPLLFWKDFGRYMLVLALFPLLLLFRRPVA